MKEIQEFLSRWIEAEKNWYANTSREYKEFKKTIKEAKTYEERVKNANEKRAWLEEKGIGQTIREDVIDYTYSEYVRESVEKRLIREAKVRLIKLTQQITKKAGEIITAELTIGQDGGFNGIIEGEKKTVQVETIIAGGYNVQRLHYRVLVK